LFRAEGKVWRCSVCEFRWTSRREVRDVPERCPDCHIRFGVFINLKGKETQMPGKSDESVISKVVKAVWECGRCNHHWLPRKGKEDVIPKQCPNRECRTRFYRWQKSNGNIRMIKQ